MNDFRRTFLWVIFGFSLVMLWDQWQVHNGRQATFFPSPKVNATATASPAKGASDASVPTSAAGSQASQSNAQAPAGAARASGVDNWVTVQTDVLKLSFDPVGGSLVRAELLKHLDANAHDKPVVLMDDQANHIYVAQSGLIAAGSAVPMPNHKSNMHFEGDRTLADGQGQVKFSFTSDVMGGVQLIKHYTIARGQYVVQVEHEIKNLGNANIEPQVYLQLVRDDSKPVGESSFYSTFTGPAIYSQEKKYQKIDFEDIQKDKAVFEKTSPLGYVAMVQHYFASAWLVKEDKQRDFYARKLDQNLYAVGMLVKAGTVAPGQTAKQSTQLFVGPQEEKKLEALYPGLELVKDYGWLTILAKPLYWLLDEIHAVVGNWGWSIVLLVVIIKAMFYWLNAKAYRSMAKMKAINPRITELRERHKSNPQQMQMEMMRIYREEKVNPLGGCLPIAIQIPVFIALYWVLLSTVEMRNASWLYVTDLARPDALFGVIPGIHLPLGPLPILMTLSSLLQTWLNPTPPDPMQAKLMWIMPLMFGVMFFFFPSGLVLYWLTNNLLSIAQQWVINRRLGLN